MISSCSNVDLNGLDPDNFQNNEGPGGGNDPNPFSLINCEEVDSTYSTSVQPVFDASCSGVSCHVEYDPSPAAGVNLDPNQDETASSMIAGIKTSTAINNFNFFQSTLITAPLSQDDDGTAHGGNTIFDSKTDPDFEKIYCWVENELEYDLDNDHNFGEELIAIFDACDGCHDGSPNPDLRINNNSVQEIYDNIISGGYAVANDTNSLILTKPTAQVMHGGNQVFAVGSTEANAITEWINSGIPAD